MHTSPPAAAFRRPDLHCHSVFSDGTQTPEALADMARSNGVDLWALTDHDTVDGIALARAAAREAGIAFLSGVEISVSLMNETVHIVGLGVDENHPGLLTGLAHIRHDRLARAQRMADGLAEAGIPGAFDGAMQYVRNPDLVSRAHFARWLVAQGVCRHTQEVFGRYLTPGKPGYVPHVWATLQDALGWIADSGGIAVLAHPGRYRYDALQREQLHEQFTALGGQAVEVVTGSHRSSDVAFYARVAQERGLLASHGSDFHDPHESKIHLGQCPDMPEGLTPVWTRLQERIQRPALH
ncbi:PHP domain-containing protein [Amphibiibacter pelophylacis]|uniref:PHP domain-containing protein n=1 Tax=Amphibiibacter pelophylacis TaxID=1799477 RepID=A0ACC6P3V9_9BURK